MAKGKGNTRKLGPKKKNKTVTVNISPSKPPEGVMVHAQIISREKTLTTSELADCGAELAKEELQLDQVRKEKKETNREFDNTIKDHLANIMRLSQAIDTGILNENIECDITINRANETKTCYPKDGSGLFVLPMTPDDFDLIT